MSKIFAIAGEEIFDRNHAKTMKLPFERGWDRWAVQKNGSLINFKTYQEAAKCARTSRPQKH